MSYILVLLFFGLGCREEKPADRELIYKLKNQLGVLAQFEASLIKESNSAKSRNPTYIPYGNLADKLKDTFNNFADTSISITDSAELKNKVGFFIEKYNFIIDSTINSKNRKYALFLQEDIPLIKMPPLKSTQIYSYSKEANYNLTLLQAYCNHIKMLDFVVSASGRYSIGCSFTMK